MRRGSWSARPCYLKTVDKAIYRLGQTRPGHAFENPETDEPSKWPCQEACVRVPRKTHRMSQEVATTLSRQRPGWSPTTTPHESPLARSKLFQTRAVPNYDSSRVPTRPLEAVPNSSSPQLRLLTSPHPPVGPGSWSARPCCLAPWTKLSTAWDKNRPCQAFENPETSRKNGLAKRLACESHAKPIG